MWTILGAYCWYGKKSGIPDDAIETQKKEFERNVQEMPKDKAIETCNAQNSIFGMVKQLQ